MTAAALNLAHDLSFADLYRREGLERLDRLQSLVIEDMAEDLRAFEGNGAHFLFLSVRGARQCEGDQEREDDASHQSASAICSKERHASARSGSLKASAPLV